MKSLWKQTWEQPHVPMLDGDRSTDVFSSSRSILHPKLTVNGMEDLVSLLTPTTKRCPHMGCALKRDPIEHTWDCPCHGSRFTKNGTLIDDPATGSINKKLEQL